VEWSGSVDRCLSEVSSQRLSEVDAQTVSRARRFFHYVRHPLHQARAMLLGYTAELHAEGVTYASWASGERPFREWREMRVRQPTRDPDVPEQVAILTAFALKWTSRAIHVALAMGDAPARGVAIRALASRSRPSSTWMAITQVQTLVALKFDARTPCQSVWSTLEADGFLLDLVRFTVSLRAVQDALRSAPLDDEEIREIVLVRENAAKELARWLDARRDQFAGLHERARAELGLAELTSRTEVGGSISAAADFALRFKA
jgi:hypothetical protein